MACRVFISFCGPKAHGYSLTVAAPFRAFTLMNDELASRNLRNTRLAREELVNYLPGLKPRRCADILMRAGKHGHSGVAAVDGDDATAWMGAGSAEIQARHRRPGA